MDPSSIVQYISETFAGVEVVVAEEGIPADDTFFMYDPERLLEPKQKMPFATIVTKDDLASRRVRPPRVPGMPIRRHSYGAPNAKPVATEPTDVVIPSAALELAPVSRSVVAPVHGPMATFRSREPLALGERLTRGCAFRGYGAQVVVGRCCQKGGQAWLAE